ncbi:MAG: division/cell wall cluster transcriptional repressor MraZ [Coriobacteriia bacterium]|nr:division/cell wall cluster transcriptional repressor MraZ [Coriobacteriia bacterium]
MFFGTYEHTMDSKGRVSLPARFRNKLGEEEIILVRGYEHCLWLFKLADYETFLAQFNDTVFDERKRRMQRWFTNGAFDVEIDTAGRIRVPASMQSYAGLGKAITFTGNQDRIELWDPSEHQSYLDSIDIDELTNELVADGIL